jgi:putative molybdopterin biosynthesis protein
MKARGVHLQYSFGDVEQRGAALHNPLFALLQAVHAHGSIQHAAKSLGASYRHIWGALKRWEATLGQPLVTWAQGQPARLTPFAERLLWAETRARARLTPHIEALRAELERVLAEALDGSQHGLTVFASHDLALPLLRDLAIQSHALHIDLRFAGSVGALAALAQGRCLVAGFHVPVLQNIPQGSRQFAAALKPLLKPGVHMLIGCLRRTQGLMVQPGNPLGLRALADLAPVAGRPLRFVNRQMGSGTRLLMDHLLAEQGLEAQAIPGWSDPPEDSHLAVAAALASGAADAGPGIEAAARAFGLGFVPLTEEDYFLVCHQDALDHPAVLKLRAALESDTWAQVLQGLAGHAPAQAGQVLSLTQALPWWQGRQARKTVAAGSIAGLDGSPACCAGPADSGWSAG